VWVFYVICTYYISDMYICQGRRYIRHVHPLHILLHSMFYQASWKFQASAQYNVSGKVNVFMRAYDQKQMSFKIMSGRNMTLRTDLSEHKQMQTGKSRIRKFWFFIESSETHKSKMHIYMCLNMKILLPWARCCLHFSKLKVSSTYNCPGYCKVQCISEHTCTCICVCIYMCVYTWL